MTDAELVLRARGGDELAFRRLLASCEGFIEWRLRSRYMKGGDHDDLRQEALLGLHKAVRDFKRERGSSFRTFAALCIDRQILTGVKRANGAKQGALNDSLSLAKPMLGAADHEDVTLDELIPDRSAKEPAEIIELRDHVTNVVQDVNAKLSEAERIALVGAAEGRSYQQISDRHDLPVKMIDNALRRARLKLLRDEPEPIVA